MFIASIDDDYYNYNMVVHGTSIRRNLPILKTYYTYFDEGILSISNVWDINAIF